MSQIATKGPPGLKSKRIISKPLRDAAEGENCTFRIEGVCRNDPAYTVWAHLRLFARSGNSMKPTDIHGAFACDRCHAIQESKAAWASAPFGYDDLLRAMMESQDILVAKGIIKVKGNKND